MFKGAQLSLYLGPVLPEPAPRELLEHLEQVSVTLGDSGRSGFQLSFRVGRDRQGGLRGFPPLMNQWLKVGTLVQIEGIVNGRGHTLMEGVITTQQLQASADPSQTVLTVTGEDLLVLLDLVEAKLPFPMIPEFARIAALLAPLSAYGVIPAIIPGIGDGPDEQDNGTTDGTPLQVIERMAQTWGYVFVWQPGPVRGVSKAYFGPPLRVGIPQRALTFGMGGDSNVSSLSFGYNGSDVKVVAGLVQDARLNSPVPVVGFPSFGPPLAAVPAHIGNLPFVHVSWLRDDHGGHTLKAFAQATSEQVNSIKGAATAQGQLDTGTYGTVLQPFGLVDVRGAGWTHDGTWYVKSVTHTIGRGTWTQAFNLEREGQGSLLETVFSA